MATIQGIYIALFGRPADPAGLAFFDEATSGGTDLTAIGDLSASDEYQARFEGLDNIQIINSIYQSLFGRDADLAGLNFFAAALASGSQTINTIAINIYDGAQGDDAAILANKEAAAELFTAEIDTGPEVVAYRGTAAADAGRAFLSPITADDATVPTQAAAAAAVEAITIAGPIGETFTLTIDAEALTGTNSADTFQAIVGGGAGVETLNTFDNLQGGNGRDVLNIAGAGAADIAANATIAGIEIVNIATTAGVTNLTSASFSGVQELWQIGANSAVSVGEGVTAGFRGGDIEGITALDGTASVKVALDNVLSGETVAITETTAGDVTAVSVSGNVAGAGALTIDTAANTTAVDTIHLALTSDSAVTFTVDNAVVTTLDAAASTGDISTNISTLAALETATFGSGNDTVQLSTGALTAETVAFSGGAGNDVFNITSAAAASDTVVTFTGGAGNDTFTFASLVTVADQAHFEDSLIVISDFDGATDVLNLSALGPYDLLSNTELANVSAAATLTAAIDLAGSYTAAAGYTIFNYDGNAYVLNSAAGGALANNDGLVELTGVSVSELTATAFIA